VRAGDRRTWAISDGARQAVEDVLVESPELRTPALDALLAASWLATRPAAPAEPPHVPAEPGP